MHGFHLTYEGFDPDEEGLREALTATGNGVQCSRGAAEWEVADGIHYPGTYRHGAYNREATIRGGLPVLNEDLVNLPNWLVLELRIDDDAAVRLADVEVLDYQHTLHLRDAALERRLHFRDRQGRETSLRSRRFVSMADVHLAGIEWQLTAENWSGRVSVVAALDGRVTNGGVPRYGQLERRHLAPVSSATYGPEVVALTAVTRQSRMYVSNAARTRTFSDGSPLAAEHIGYEADDYVQQVLTFDVTQGRTVTVEKMVACSTSRDPATSDTQDRAATLVQRAPDFTAALERHDVAWEELWRVCDVVVPQHPEVQQLLRLHICHVLQVCSPHTADVDAGVPARGLSGEAYRGHVFWDELFVYPFLTLRRPEITRGLLMYRFRRLDEARAGARAAGYRGAMYPWQSGSEGTEETQRVHLNPLSGHWDPDRSHHQRHVNAAIFYNVWQYFQATHDHGFLRDRGAEMMLEIARFWASIATFDQARGRYVIHGVMGPDEFHERDPGADGDGLRNNAYTNVMVAWLCGIAAELLGRLPASRARALREQLRLEDEELRTWEDMSRRMFVPFHDGIISQFEGYEALEELDWDGYRARYGDIQRLDRILRAEGDDPNRYKASKQADAVMLPFLFPRKELEAVFARLGYAYGPECEQRTVSYYDERTSHGSTLSSLAFAGALAAADPERSWAQFLMALGSDVGDIQNGTTREGIHLGAMAGTLDLIQRCYAGVHLRDDVLCFDPRPPAQLGDLSFSLQFRDTPVQVEITKGRLSICALPEGVRAPIKVGLCDDARDLSPGGRVSFDLPESGS